MNALNKTIRQAIVSAGGVISFARFMELSLYCPHYGYYEQERDTTGRAGDFYTNVSVGGLFGELLAFQFAQWFFGTAHGNESGARMIPVQLVEAGAHDGRLAADILNCLQKQSPQFFDNVEYWIIEPSVRRRNLQQKKLGAFTGKVRWLESLTTLPKASVTGVIFSNELLDAMPCHRLGWNAKNRSWFEWGVAREQDGYIWAKLPDSADGKMNERIPADLEQLPGQLQAVLPDGFTTECCPMAEVWWRQASAVLRSGKLFTIDYGLASAQLISPQRAKGTLRAYRRHQVNDDLLANVGDQDLTAHVNFTKLQSAGEAAGLKTELCCPQAKFLTQIAERTWSAGSRFCDWTSSRRRQFQTLTHPDHLGRPFQVLLQSR